MSMRKILFATVASLSSALASAANISGVIRTIAVNTLDHRIYVQFEGPALINGVSSCPSYWIAAELADQEFMKYAYPLLIAAKASASPVTIGYSDCLANYPRMVSVDYEPRLQI